MFLLLSVILMVDKHETVQLAIVPQETDFSYEIDMQFQFLKNNINTIVVFLHCR